MASATTHTTVYRKPGQFAGWPANGGMWSYDAGREVVCVFTVGSCQPGASGAGAAIHHTIDHSQPLTTTQARSLDGGVTWTAEPIPAHVPGGVALSADEHTDSSMKLATVLATDEGGRKVEDCPGGVPLQHPDFALLCARTGLGPGTISLFYYSVDRCRSWLGPFALPSFGQTGLAARTDYVVLGPESILLLLTANKKNGAEGKVCCVRSDDGCRTWALQSFVDGDVEPIDEQIMPASLQIPGGAKKSALYLNLSLSLSLSLSLHFPKVFNWKQDKPWTASVLHK
jgi:hypothetical protein